MRKVRVTMNPDKVIEVDDKEYTDLKRQGLLVEDKPKSSAQSSASSKDKEKDK